MQNIRYIDRSCVPSIITDYSIDNLLCRLELFPGVFERRKLIRQFALIFRMILRILCKLDNPLFFTYPGSGINQCDCISQRKRESTVSSFLFRQIDNISAVRYFRLRQVLQFRFCIFLQCCSIRIGFILPDVCLNFFRVLIIFQIVLSIIYRFNSKSVLSNWNNSCVIIVGTAFSLQSFKIEPGKEKGSLILSNLLIK